MPSIVTRFKPAKAKRPVELDVRMASHTDSVDLVFGNAGFAIELKLTTAEARVVADLLRAKADKLDQLCGREAK